MNIHGLRKYMIRRFSCIKTLKREVPKALKHSPNPARLILECIGMFYSQASNAYVEGSPLIPERKAKVLLLECFLKMMGEVGQGQGEGGVVEIENGVKEEAEQAALAWYRRLNFEGGILKAQEIDARGLLLLIGCFGIPQAFRNEDVKDLLQQSYIKMISGSLRRSSVLMAKIPEIIEGMLKQNVVVDAVYFALCFGLEDRFHPQRLLTSFLLESEVSSYNKIKRFEQMEGSLAEIIGVKRRYLGGLKSVIQCLGRNNIDHSKLLPEWQIGRKIISLEKEIAKLRKKLKGGQKMARKRQIDETEWLSNKEVKHSHCPNPWPLQQQRVVNLVDSNNTLLEGGGTAGHIYGHSVYPPVLYSHLERPTTITGDAYSRVPAYMESSKGLPNTKLSDVNRPPPYLEGSAGLPNTITCDAYKHPSYLGGSTGLPNTIPPPYQFADTVPATELYRSSGSRAVDAVPSAMPAHPSSSLY